MTRLQWALAAMLASAACTGQAQATELIDQNFLGYNSNGTLFPGYRYLQTFTVGITGILTRVDFYGLFAGYGPTSMVLDIFPTTAAGVPTGYILAGGYAPTISGNVISFQTSLAVVAGQVLALEPLLTGTDPAYFKGTYSGFADYVDYTRGQLFYSDVSGILTGNVGDIKSDIDFTTYVTVPTAVPEPAQWSMLIGGFALAGGAMRRRVAAVRLALARP